MKKVLLVAVLAMFATVTAVMAQEAAAEKKAESKATTVIYTCDKCQKVALAAGKCDDQDMKAMKVLAVKDGVAICCPCGVECKCKIKEGDATKCGCDKDVKKVALKGMFCCDKDGVIADKEGKCPVCSGDLKAAPAAEAPKAEAPAAK